MNDINKNEKNLDKIILLTGVGGGIGQTFLHHLKDKANLIITSSRSKKGDIIKDNENSNIIHYPLDLTKESNVIELCNLILNKYGAINTFINTIGGSLFSHKLEDFSLDEFRKILELNLVSAFLLTKEVIKIMKKDGGNIIHVVSASAKSFPKNKGPYGIAKAALVKLIQYFATEVAEYNIRINGISPTYVFTSRHEFEINEKMKNKGILEENIIKNIVKPQLIKKPMYSEDLIPVLDLLINTKVITGQIFNCALGQILSY